MPGLEIADGLVCFPDGLPATYIWVLLPSQSLVASGHVLRES